MTPPTYICSPARIKQLLGGDILDREDYVQLSKQARAHDKVEKYWKRKFREAIFEAAFRAMDDLALGVELDPDEFDFDSLVVGNAIDAMRAGLKKPRITSKHLAAPKPPMKRIFQMWDEWRKKPTAKQKKNAATIKRTFLHTVQKFWREKSRDFRIGDTYDMTAARDAFVKRASIPVARADMIVTTETCRFYNTAITTLYDKAEGVTHYFFVAILDRRTTGWCCDFHKGGRHGLVYTKGAAVTEKERPPCHYNCRSQFFPLSLSNPKHRKLIEDASRARAGRSPKPLLRGWNT